MLKTESRIFIISCAYANKSKKDCLWKQRTHNGLEDGSLGFIETLHKQ